MAKTQHLVGRLRENWIALAAVVWMILGLLWSVAHVQQHNTGGPAAGQKGWQVSGAIAAMRSRSGFDSRRPSPIVTGG